MPHSHSESHTKTTEFPRETAGLPEAEEPEVVELADGDRFELEIAPVTKQSDDATVRMLLQRLRPRPHAEAAAGRDLHRPRDEPRRPRCHGALAPACASRTATTEPTTPRRPVPVGETFTYEVHVPDAGAYWYHPHIREDYGQELGLYGNILVTPSDADYWPPAHRELLLTLDDLLIEDGRIAAFGGGHDTRGDGTLRERHARLRRAGPRAPGETRRGCPPLLHEHGQHTRLQRNAAGRADEARRGRRGPLRARSDRRRGSARALGACRRRRALSERRRAPARAPNPERTYRLASIRVADEEPQEPFADESSNCGRIAT